MNKKAIAFSLSVILTASLTACGTSKHSNEKDAVKTTTDSATTQTYKKKDWRKPYTKPVTLTTVRAEQSADFPKGDDLTNNIWTRSYKDKFNVNVKTDWVSSDYDTKINLAIASKSLPDVFLVNGVQFNQLKEAGLLCDLTKAYETTASDTTRSYMEEEKDIFETAKDNGKLYAIPRLYDGDILSPKYVWLRKDWMKKIGADAPKSMDDLEQIFLDMMDKGAEYGLSVQQDFTPLFDLAPAWHASPNIWIKTKGGKIEYGSVQPEMKKALAAWADWYKKGIIKSDFSTMDMNAVNQDAINGKVGVMTGQSSWGWIVGKDLVNNQGVDAEFQPCRIPSVDGKEVRTPIQFPNLGYIAVSKNCKNPEAVIKLINYYNYVVFDAVNKGDMTIDEMTKYTGGNMAHVTDMFRVRNPMDDYNRLVEIQDAIKSGDKSKITSGIGLECYEGSLKWINNKEPEGYGYASQFGNPDCSLLIGKDIVDKDLFNRSEVKGVTPDVLLNYGSTLDDLLLEGFTKIVMGAKPVDYFNTLVKDWKAAGGDQATAAVNEMYGK